MKAVTLSSVANGWSVLPVPSPQFSTTLQLRIPRLNIRIDAL
jgi:hypothetical protein